LTKLEEIKKKGTQPASIGATTKRLNSNHEMFKDPERVKTEHSKIKKTKRMVQRRELETQNVKLAFHLHKTSASIDVKKQLGDFEQHQKLL